MKFKESTKAVRRGQVLRADRYISNPKQIRDALMSEINVVGIFHDPNFFDGIECYRVYRIKNEVLYHMVLLPNRDLHLMMVQSAPDEVYENDIPLQILSENEHVFFDQDNVIDVRKAHVPDSPNADQIRAMLKA